MGEWQPIETAPKGTNILGWSAGMACPLVFEWFPAVWRRVDKHGQRAGPKPTHWQPLPAPPS